MYRIIVLLFDFGILGIIIFFTITAPPNNGVEILMVAFIYLVVFLNLIYVLISKTAKESWITLYFQRKRLEEKRKIETLRNE
jgi:hypothetical protein